MVAFGVFWLAVTGFNMWVGVSRAGYSVGEEIPIFLLLRRALIAAILLRWKLS